jgi:hypothetical protein
VVGPDPAHVEEIPTDFVAVKVSSVHAGLVKGPAQVRPRNIEQDEAMYWRWILEPGIGNEGSKHEQVAPVRLARSLGHVEFRFMWQPKAMLKSGHQMV